MKLKKLNIFTRIARRLRINRKYRDYLFRFIFKDKGDLLELYNAINGTNYTNPDDLQITTMEDVVYLGMKNDVSFIIGYTLNLYEHQSTFNPNMPLRGLFYFADILRAYVEENKLNLYGRKQLRLPLPQYIVFYNGVDDLPDRMEQRLSDSFENKENSALECKAVMLNINYGHNQEILNKCQRLEEYAYFVFCVRENLKLGVSAEDAINRAVDECIRQGKLADVLAKNRGEVLNMLLTDFDLEEYGKMLQRDSYEDGIADGIAKGKAEGKAEALLEILRELGEIPPNLENQIRGESDLSQFTKWIKLAVKVESIQEFMNAYRK